MRLLSLIAFVCAQIGWAQSNCPSVAFPAPKSAALLSSPSTHRLLVKQSDGSYTAYERSNTSPYPVLRTIPHFDRQLSACVQPTTALYTFVVTSVTPVPAGGYFVTIVNQNQSFFDIFDANFNLIAESSKIPAFQFADMNGDGMLDAISTPSVNHNGAISIALGNGGASFQTPVVYPTPYPSIQTVVVGDVNRDGKPDIMVLGFGQIALYLGNGDGTLQAPKIITQETQTEVSLALADLNGDGILDLVYGDLGPTYQPVVKISLGNGDGTFQPAVAFSAATTNMTVGDLNGDGIPDILADGTILFGDGKGGFPTRRDIAGSGSIITDFDGDGIADIVSGVGTAQAIGGDSVSVIFGTGKGNFAAPSVSLIPGFPSSDNGLLALAAADFNGDGIPDLVAAELEGHISVMQGVGDGTFKNTLQYTFSGGLPTGVVFGDFNRDGNTDFAVVGSGYATSSSGGISIGLGKGDGTFLTNQISAPLGSYALVTGDFNGDGKLDLAVLVSQYAAAVSDNVQILLGNGDGTFHTGGSFATGPNSISIVAGDFNGDGKLDIVVTNIGTYLKNYSEASLVLLTGKGDGTFSTPTTLPYISSTYRQPYSAIAADFNGDGKLDLAVTLSDASNFLGGLMILLGRGDGTFQTPAYYAVEGYYHVTAGDLNGDGIPDLVLSGYSASYLLGNGDGTFKSPVPVPGASFPVAIADLNRDGKGDLAASLGQQGIGGYLNVTPLAPAITMVSAATLEPAPIAPASIVTAFGKNLSGAVSATDSAGVSGPATLFYSSPTQVNFVVPAGLEPGPATVTIGSQTAAIELAPVAPSIFTLTPGGLAAAYVTRASAAGPTYEPIFTEHNGVITPVPIDVSVAAGQAYLVLFGTGIRNSTAARVELNGNYYGVSYAGPQPGIAGLDQINLPLPIGLASGYTNILLTQGNLAANPVYVVIK